MPRTPRLVIPGFPLHVIQRGNNRCATFHSVHDFDRFRKILCRESRRFSCQVHAYVFMTNHAHILVTPEDEQGVSRMMQAVGRQYVQYVNIKYERTGTLWEGRYRSSLIDSERYMFVCSRYIELNPVRAGMTDDPGAYVWSSYRHNAYGSRDPLITPHPLYEALARQSADRQTAYRGLFADAVSEEAIESIRRATNIGDVLGDDDFRQRVEISLQRSLTRPRHGGDRRSAAFRSSNTPCSPVRTVQVF